MHRSTRLAPLLLAPLLLALCAGFASARGEVLLVGGPDADFSTLQAAIDAASDGDVVLARGGVYSSAVIDDKTLTLAADSGAVVETTGIVRVHDLSLGKTVTLSGLTMRSTSAGGSFASHDCAGTILVQDCQIRVVETGGIALGAAAVILNCASVTFVRCEIRGVSRFAPVMPGAGLAIGDSDVALHDCRISGATGGPGKRGLPAIAASGGELSLYGCSLTGGLGGDGDATLGSCEDGGQGGPALLLSVGLSGDPIVRHTRSTFLGGAGGLAHGACTDGPNGASIQGPFAIEQLATAPRTYSATTPVRHGDELLARYTGAPGDLVVDVVSLQALPTPYLAEWSGAFLPSLPTAQLTPVGELPLSGVLETAVPVSFTGDGALLFVQALLLGTDGQAALSNPQSVLVLGP